MMQGNSGSFADDNRINGDGALFIRFTGGETVALFSRFSTQATQTDNTGAPLSNKGAQAGQPAGHAKTKTKRRHLPNNNLQQSSS